MLIYILKKLGRLFVILTHEDLDIDPTNIRKGLIISLPSEEHLFEAAKFISNRFKYASFDAIAPSTKRVFIEQFLTISNIHLVDSKDNTFIYLDSIDKFVNYKYDIVIVLSLNPYLILEVLRYFKIHILLYNYCGESYLIRFKTLHEILCGAEGVDRKRAYIAMGNNSIIYIMIYRIIKVPVKIMYYVLRFFYLCFYAGTHIFLLLSKRWYYKLIHCYEQE